tara:strand:- start:7986 stop:9389 length:1404 start_codon:yes stop_codon:yes gene_type:complete
MLFNKIEYLFFFIPIVFLLFFLSNRNYSKPTLIFASIFFYGWWNINYLFLIFFSIFINFFIYKILTKSEFNKKKLILFIGISINIFMLIIFKYLDFFIENYNYLFSSNLKKLNLPFPLAISFFTFQQIAFLVDSYDNEINKFKFTNYFLFIFFFPQLIAGPICKYNHICPQFEKKNFSNINFHNISTGILILLIGLFKKVVLADNLATISSIGFADIDNLTFIDSWISLLCFTFQFYFDFSGYVDMATGSALIFNVRLPINFDSPFKAKSIKEFWQRWHITLTNFLTFYIYVPILRSFTNINIITTSFVTLFVFFIAGIWHGPSWNFVMFGLMHGVAIVFNNIFSFKNIINDKIKWFFTFIYVSSSFVFFRSSSFEDAINMFKSLFDISSIINFTSFHSIYDLNSYPFIRAVVILILSFYICVNTRNSNIFLKEFRPNFKYLSYSIIGFVLSLWFMTNSVEFLYFKF